MINLRVKEISFEKFKADPNKNRTSTNVLVYKDYQAGLHCIYAQVFDSDRYVENILVLSLLKNIFAHFMSIYQIIWKK